MRDRGRTESTARMLAADLLKGAKAELVGGKYLRGTSPQYVELDGVPVEWPMSPRKEAVGVRTILPDGYVALYLTATHEQARSLLADAEAIVTAEQ